MGVSVSGWQFWRAFEQNRSKAIKMFRAFDPLIPLLGSWLKENIASVEKPAHGDVCLCYRETGNASVFNKGEIFE